MPITYYIDHPRKLVVARGTGVFTEADAFGYQRTVWSRADVQGYAEIVDMAAVTEIAVRDPAGPGVQALAMEAAGMDRSGTSSRFAIVAPDELAFGLGRMYAAYRGLDPRSTKEVGVFRTVADALEFLGIDDLGEREISEALATASASR